MGGSLEDFNLACKFQSRTEILNLFNLWALRETEFFLFQGAEKGGRQKSLVAHDCGYPLSRYTCRATRVAADFLDFIAFCRCSTGVALHPPKILESHPPPPVPGGVAPKLGSEKVSHYTVVSQLQLRVSRYTVQLRKGVRITFFAFLVTFWSFFLTLLSLFSSLFCQTPRLF